jgi:DNA-binding transcriptional MerR regulator
MAQWRVKEMSLMTSISVRMLHHYDKIGLLKPSMRSSNGYRCYSEQDLATLQQIIALKFFGFSLAQIKTMLQQKPNAYEHLCAQQQMLLDQAEYLRQAHDTLAAVLTRYEKSDSLGWSELISLIERYRMTEELKNTWAERLNDKQKERYVKFRRAYPKEVTAFEATIESINTGQLKDHEGQEGKKAVDAFSKMTQAKVAWEATALKNEKMTKESATDLLETIEQFKTKEISLSLEGQMSFAKALTAQRLQCWDTLHQDIIKNLDAAPEGQAGKKLAKQWRDLVAEHCIGGGPNDFHFGVNILMETARGKVELQDLTEQSPEQKQQNALKGQRMADAAKILRDPMALDWIFRALKKH